MTSLVVEVRSLVRHRRRRALIGRGRRPPSATPTRLPWNRRIKACSTLPASPNMSGGGRRAAAAVGGPPSDHRHVAGIGAGRSGRPMVAGSGGGGVRCHVLGAEVAQRVVGADRRCWPARSPRRRRHDGVGTPAAVTARPPGSGPRGDGLGARGGVRTHTTSRSGGFKSEPRGPSGAVPSVDTLPVQGLCAAPFVWCIAVSPRTRKFPVHLLCTRVLKPDRSPRSSRPSSSEIPSAVVEGVTANGAASADGAQPPASPGEPESDQRQTEDPS